MLKLVEQWTPETNDVSVNEGMVEWNSEKEILMQHNTAEEFFLLSEACRSPIQFADACTYETNMRSDGQIFTISDTGKFQWAILIFT
jgi:hypothetical protein